MEDEIKKAIENVVDPLELLTTIAPGFAENKEQKPLLLSFFEKKMLADLIYREIYRIVVMCDSRNINTPTGLNNTFGHFDRLKTLFPMYKKIIYDVMFLENTHKKSCC